MRGEGRRDPQKFLHFPLEKVAKHGRLGLICGTPQFDRSSVTMGTYVPKVMGHCLKNSFHVEIPLKNVRHSLNTLFLTVEINDFRRGWSHLEAISDIHGSRTLVLHFS